MIEQISHNGLCWAIILLALVCYQRLWLDYLVCRSRSENLDNHADTKVVDYPQGELSGVLIGALPLIGLLGTIVGLMDCFLGIASQGGSAELVSSGIADALLTTQLGLVCAIPAWLLQCWVQASTSKYLQPIAHDMSR